MGKRTIIEAKKSLSLSSRFSSGDLSSELEDEPSARTGLASVGRQDSAQNYQGLAERPLQSQPQPMPPPSQPVPGAPPPPPPQQPPSSDLSLNLRPSSRTTSAPSSPAKTRESLLQRVQSLTGAARDQVSSTATENAIVKMAESHLDETGSQGPRYMVTVDSLTDNNESGQKEIPLESAVETECVRVQSKTVNVPVSEDLLPVRMTIGSQYYTAAYRLDESNVCAEAVEAILFDSLDGECILAEYQQNNCLSSTTQQKLTDLLLTRSAKSLIGCKNIQNYFVKLTDAIVRLMPNEDPNVYYIPPQSSGNDSKNPKGKLPDKWRNLTYQLRMRGILSKKKTKDKLTNTSEFSSSSTAQSVRAAVDNHMKSLQMSESSLSQLLIHWDATIEYRKLLRSSQNNLHDVLFEWPILRTDKGPHLIDYEFKHLHGEYDITSKWITFFNALYDVKKSSIRDGVGKEYCNLYERSSIRRPDILAGIQIQLLPYLITPMSKFKTASGITVKPSMIESSEGFVIYSQGASILGAAVSGATRGQGFGGKDRFFTLLVIDDQNTDWSKYFRGRRLHGDYEIRVEQAEFREISLTASELGTTVSMAVIRNGTKVIRSFKPDFVLVRQNLRDASENYKNILLGLMYGGIPSVNNLQAIYNFQDKPWVFAHLLGLQRRLGRENFPLIEQTFYPNHREMISAPRYPVVVKLGHAHSGVGKARAENSQEFLDLASMAAMTKHYCTSEPYIDTKYDVHVQKIGQNYKAFMRKSISGNWKSNTGSAMLEQLAVTERHRAWVDQVGQLFGGLDICAIELLVSKDSKEYIIEVNDSALSLMGDSQEEDRRHIADLVTAKMQAYCRVPGAPPPLTKTHSRGSMSGSSQIGSPTDDARGPPGSAGPTQPHSSVSSSAIGSMSSVAQESMPPSQPPPQPPDHHQQLQRRDSQASQSSTVSSAPSVGRRDEPPPVPPTSRMSFQRQGSQSQATGEDTEDTMKNLRKTFAGIFGDM